MDSRSTPAVTSPSRFFVPKLAHQWFIACRSRDLTERPLAVTVQGVPLVLFRRGGGRPTALEDRCPHRNAPLAVGRVRDGELECAYHGWRFDGAGTCVAVPGLATRPEERATRATAFPCLEQDGYLWVYSTPGAEPRREPFAFPSLGPRYTTVRRELDVTSTLVAALENALDVPHTAFLHGGLFRAGAKATEIDVIVRRFGDRCEAEFIGEPRPKGIAGRLLAPAGGIVTHFDRFLLPSIAQVEYRLGDGSHLVVTTAMTPVDDFRTRLFAVVALRLPIPARLLLPLLEPIVTRIFEQDARILRLQTENVRRFGGERFASTGLDALGPHIRRLLKDAEPGEVPLATAVPEHEHRARMQV